MSGYLPQVILVVLIIYSLLTDYLRDGKIRVVALENTAMGWCAVVVLLIWGGLFG